jgi:hypothetical protein
MTEHPLDLFALAVWDHNDHLQGAECSVEAVRRRPRDYTRLEWMVAHRWREQAHALAEPGHQLAQLVGLYDD